MRPTLIVPVALAAAFVGASPAAYAQDDAADVAEPGMGADRSALSAAAESYVHHVLIARPEQAMASATVLLAADVDAADLADAVDAADLTKRMDDAFRRSRGMPEVADAAMQLETKLEAGRRALARKVDRINASLPRAQQITTVTLDYEFKTVADLVHVIARDVIRGTESEIVIATIFADAITFVVLFRKRLHNLGCTIL